VFGGEKHYNINKWVRPITIATSLSAPNWENKLRGDVKRDRIEWENGSIWTRQPTRRLARR